MNVKSVRSSVFVVMVCWVVAAGRCWSAPEYLVQPYSRSVEWNSGSGGSPVVGVRLDSQVYAAASDSLADLRLVSGAGRELPYALETEVARSAHDARDNVSVQVESVREVGSNALEIVWSPVRSPDLPAPVIRGFAVETMLRNFERRVTVSGLEGAEWRVLATNELLYDYSRYMDIRRLEVVLPTNGASRFRMVIDEIQDVAQSPFTEIVRQVGGDGRSGGRTERFSMETRPLRVDRIRAWALRRVEVAEREVVVEYGDMPFSVEEDVSGKRTMITAVSCRAPLTQVSLETASRNFCRRAELQVPVVDGIRKEWRTIAEATLTAIEVGSFRERRLGFDFAAQRQPRYRVVIPNGDSAPLQVSAVRCKGQAQRLLFIPDGVAGVRLVYGGRDIPAAEYDMAGVLAALRGTAGIAEGRLGAEAAVQCESRGVSCKRVLNSPLFFGGAVVAAVLALGWMMFSAVRRGGAS